MKIYMKSIEIYDTIITTIFRGVKEAVRGNLWLIGTELELLISNQEISIPVPYSEKTPF